MATILVVDDEPMVCDLLADFFRQKGYTVQSAHSGAEALDMVEAERPDIVLLDVAMPGMSGFEVLERLRARHPSMPVIMVTGLKEQALADRAMSMGAAAYITKPIDLHYLDSNVFLKLWRKILGDPA